MYGILHPMNNFKGNRQNGRQKFAGKKSFDNNKRHGAGPRRDTREGGGSDELFSATCSECTKRCDVPFRPSPNKPVYCSACFGMKKSANESRDSGNRNNRFDRGSDRNERPEHTKPPRDQRSPRHDPTRGRGTDGITELKQQISGLEQKLNKILDLINPPVPSQKIPTTVKNEKIVEETPKKKPKKAASKKPAVKKAAKKVAKKVTKKAVKKATAKKTAVKKVTKKKVAKKTKK